MLKPANECELATAVSSWLRGDGWRTWHEVQVASGRIDILAVRAGLVWAVETKMHGGVEVIAQALDRRGYGCHGALIAVPATKSHAAHTICRHLGLGLITVKTGEYASKYAVNLELWPDFQRHARTKKLLAGLNPEQETQAPGRSAAYWTPFKTLVKDFTAALKNAKRLPLDDAIELACVKVYRGDKQTAAQLRRYVSDSLERKLFPDVRVEGAGRVKTVVYDPGWAEHKVKPPAC